MPIEDQVFSAARAVLARIPPRPIPGGREWARLTGQCMKVSFALVSLLRDAGIRAHACAGMVHLPQPVFPWAEMEPHTWVILEDNGKQFLLDATLRQFQDGYSDPIPDVVFGPRYQVEARWGYLPEKEPFKRSDV